VTHDLTESLVAKGHEVTLFATALSRTSADLVVTAETPLSEVPPADRRAIEDQHIENAIEAIDQEHTDVVHSHLHVHVLQHADRLSPPVVTTLHGSAWDRAHHRQLRRHAHRPFVSLSDRERLFLPDLNYVATVPNGIRLDDFPAGDGAGGYLTFVGRLAPEKAPLWAIECARRSGRRLKIAGVIEEAHRDYAEKVLARCRDGIEYLGPLQRPDLSNLLMDSDGLLMPLTWDEPFGLVVVEALASGTPVVAWARGAMPEIVADGVTGYLVDDVEAATLAVSKLGSISRDICRVHAETRFSDSVMAQRYGVVYEAISSPSPQADHSRT
jgi:glycosyltransferase involved in cell wall biosynthesis